MKRGGPLRRITPLKAKTSLKRTPFKSKPKPDSEWRTARKAAIRRAHGRCEARWDGCYGISEHVHHILRRSQGGSNDIDNLLVCCCWCHTQIHNQVQKAYDRGHLRRRQTS